MTSFIITWHWSKFYWGYKREWGYSWTNRPGSKDIFLIALLSLVSPLYFTLPPSSFSLLPYQVNEFIMRLVESLPFLLLSKRNNWKSFSLNLGFILRSSSYFSLPCYTVNEYNERSGFLKFLVFLQFLESKEQFLRSVTCFTVAGTNFVSLDVEH